MSQLLSLSITSKTVGGETVINNPFPGTKNLETYSPAVTRAFNTDDIISPIRYNGKRSYFTFQELKGMDIESRKDTQLVYFSSDSLSAIRAKCSLFALLTVEFRDAIRQVNMNSEQMLFDITKILGPLTPVAVGTGTIFSYIEDGNPNPMEYTVAETIAQILSQTNFGTIVDKEVPSGAIDGVNTVFTLSAAPLTNTEYVNLNGALQTGGGVDYTISGSTITFNIAPAPGSQLWVTYRK